MTYHLKFDSFCVSFGSLMTLLYFFMFCISTSVALDDSSKAEIEEIVHKKLKDSEEIDRAVKKHIDSDEGRKRIQQVLLSDQVQQEMKKQLTSSSNSSDFVRDQVIAYLKTMDYEQAFRENTGYCFETILAIMATALILPSVLINIMLLLCFKCVKSTCCDDKPPKQPAQRQIVDEVPNTVNKPSQLQLHTDFVNSISPTPTQFKSRSQIRYTNNNIPDVENNLNPMN